MSKATKATKAQATYTFHPGENYTCGSCVMLKDAPNGHGCAWFGVQRMVSPTMGSCNYYAHGDPKKLDIPWIGIFTPVQLGYDENRNGFTCGRCEEFHAPGDCEKVDKASPGDTPGEISPKGCCSLWKRDPVRGGLADDRLVQILAKPAGGLKALAMARKQA